MWITIKIAENLNWPLHIDRLCVGMFIVGIKISKDVGMLWEFFLSKLIKSEQNPPLHIDRLGQTLCGKLPNSAPRFGGSR